MKRTEVRLNWAWLVIVAGLLLFLSQDTFAAVEFTAHVLGPAATVPGVAGVAVADMDGDEDLDVVATGLGGTKIFRNDGSGVYVPVTVDTADAERVQVVDFTGDSKLDLLVTLPSNSPSVVWYRNQGDLTFTATLLGSGTKASAYALDLNADGKPDVVTATEQTGAVTLQHWMNNGSGTFTAATIATDTGITAVTLADVDDNGFPDIVSGGTKGLQRWSTTNGSSWTVSDIDSSNQSRTHVVVGDTTNDGKMDIVTADESLNTVAVYRGREGGVWQRQVLSESTDARSVVLVDLDRDGDRDVVVGAQDDGSVVWFENRGGDVFIKTTIAASLARVFDVAPIDLDGDGDLDLVAGDSLDGTVYWYEQTSAVASPVVSPSPVPSPTPPSDILKKPPVANAGADQIVSPGSVVTLDGSGSSDSDGGKLTYQWRQLSGPPTTLVSDQAAAASFTAEATNTSYIFVLTVRDESGALASDTVTIAVGNAAPTVAASRAAASLGLVGGLPDWSLGPARGAAFITASILFALALLATGFFLSDHFKRMWQERRTKHLSLKPLLASTTTPHGRVVHFRTGEPVVGALVRVFESSTDELKVTEHTDAEGRFSTLFPPGRYRLAIDAEGFVLAPAATLVARPEDGAVYTGGEITVSQGAVQLLVPMKPSGHGQSVPRVRVLSIWQGLESLGRALSWPLIISGAVITAGLLVFEIHWLFLVFEAGYGALAIARHFVGAHVQTTYGMVRDAVSKAPLDLAVVRFFTADTNRLTMTRITNSQGTFVALPSSGTYTMIVTRPGYAPFSKHNLVVAADGTGVSQFSAELVPVKPQ